MNPNTKSQLSKVTLYSLMSVASFFIVGTIVITVCVGFHINPFREQTTSFLITAFIGAVELSIVSLFLNVAVNLSLISESMSQVETSTAKTSLRPWLIGLGVVSILVVAMIFLGTSLSERKFLSIVRAQVDQVVAKNPEFLDKIAQQLKDSSNHQLWKSSQIMKYLASQRHDLPQVMLIYQNQFEGKAARYGIESHSWDEAEPKNFQPPYYGCTQGLDCDYLDAFFAGGAKTVLEKNNRTDDSFFIYYPVEKDGIRFVLRFGRTQRYGKLGSS